MLPAQKNPPAAILLLVAANLLWAGQGIAVKLLARGLHPLAIALLPLYIATLLGLAILCAQGGIAQKFKSAWKLHREFLLAGICGQFTAQVGMTIGVSWSTASNGAVLSLLIPVFGALLAVWILRERLSLLRIGALLLGLAGVFLISPLHRISDTGMRNREFAGNLLIMAGCLGSAFYNIYSKRLLGTFSELEALVFSYLSTFVFGLPVLLLFEPHCFADLAYLSIRQWLAFGYLALLFYGLSMVFFLKALKQVDAVIASASLYLVPLFGVLLASNILEEHLPPVAVLGSVTVLMATLLLYRFDTSF